MKKSVAIISPEFRPYTNWGGVATFNEELALLLSDMGLDVHVIAYNPISNTNQKEIFPHVTRHLVSLKTDNKAINVCYYKLLRPILSLFFRSIPDFLFFLEWNFFAWWYFRKLNHKKRFIAIHSPSYFSPSILIKTLNNQIKLILHIQGPQEGLNIFLPRKLDNIIKAKVENWFATSLADIVITCNLELKNKYASMSKKPQSVLFIPNFVTIRLRTTRANKFNPNNLVFWGRLENRKGTETLIKAYIFLRKNNPKLHLWLLGKDDAGLKLGQRFVGLDQFLDILNVPENIKQSIHHIPRIDERNTLRELVKTLNGICVFPSHHEPFGFVYVEAMAEGMITIGSSMGEGKNIINHGINGFISDTKSSSLCKTILLIQSLSKNEITKISKSAQKRVEAKYSLQAALAAYRKLYKSLSIY